MCPALSTSRPPLAGIRVVEFAGLGPAPFAAMMLADLGAAVLRIDRPNRFDVVGTADPLCDGKRVVELDLKQDADRATALALVTEADVLLEGFRPGTMERLGLGPDECRAGNPRLVYVRIDGWGEHGTLADRAGHDINYLAELGLLDMIGTPATPVPPLNLVADFGGAGMSAVVGTLAALLARRESGTGSVVRTSLFEGAAYLAAMLCGQAAQGSIGARGGNLLDGGHPLYRAYRCRDGAWLAVGALEPVFARRFLTRLGLTELLEELPHQERWAELVERISTVIDGESAAYWEAAFTRIDACVNVSRAFPQTLQNHPFYRVADHHRPHLPITFDARRPLDLTAQIRITAEEAIAWWT